MNKTSRQQALVDIIRSKRLGNQHELLNELGKLGIEGTQSTVSRDLSQMGVHKFRGVYALPADGPGQTPAGAVLDLETAGAHLIVVKTPPGQASMMALAVDRERIPGVVGTVAGDDTFFVAVKSPSDQAAVVRQIKAITGRL